MRKNDYNFCCMAVSPVGSVSITPRNNVFEQGTNATLTCNNQGGPDNVIVWKVDEDILPFTNSHQISVLVNESTGGNYTCNVSNAAGFETDSTMFYTHPLITADPEQFVDVTNGTITSLSCDAVGFPEPLYQWIRSNNLPVRTDIVDASRPNVLGFEPAVFGDEGTYICKAFFNIDGMLYEDNSTAAIITCKSIITAVATFYYCMVLYILDSVA